MVTRSRYSPLCQEADLDFVELTTKPIDINKVARRLIPPECGATVTLDGYARRFTRETDGSLKETLYLVYEAYDSMAVKEMKRLASEAGRQFAISSVGIVHRTGKLEIGETSVVISVAAPHRIAAFQACEWLIRELKRVVPIWKKEFYKDGAEQWVEGETMPSQDILNEPRQA